MVKVSVVIPVYNGEAYLHQCLDSVCVQTLEEIEIICVDDGSTDGSWQILKEYEEKDSRFRLFQQEHQYPPAARNNGLEQAQGEYVIFWDCDDFFEPRALEHLYLRAEETEADICVCKNDLYYSKDGKRYPDGTSLNLKRIPEGGTFNRLTNPDHILRFCNGAVWNKLFRRSFLVENNLSFSDFRMMEDQVFLYVALCLASKIAIVKKVLIHYRWNNPKSMVGSQAENSISIESIRAMEFLVEQLRQRDIVPKGLGRRTIEVVISTLHWANTEANFVAILQYLRERGLWEKFDIREREPEYYYSARHHEYVKHLLHDEPGDVLAFFMHEGWQELRFVKADRRRVKAQLKKLKNRLAKDTEAYESKLTNMARANEQLTAAYESKLTSISRTNEQLTAELGKMTAKLEDQKKQLKTIKNQLKTTQKNLQALQNSRSYRLGRMLLWLPRKIRGLLKNFRQ